VLIDEQVLTDDREAINGLISLGDWRYTREDCEL
jgi:hypothetical protein